MKTYKTIGLKILIIAFSATALNWAFAGEAIEQLNGAALNAPSAFDGSKSYSGTTAGTEVKGLDAKSTVTVEKEKTSTWESVKQTLQKAKPWAIVGMAGALAGFFLFGTVAGALTGGIALIGLIWFLGL